MLPLASWNNWIKHKAVRKARKQRFGRIANERKANGPDTWSTRAPARQNDGLSPEVFFLVTWHYALMDPQGTHRA